jgi:hypothetical protein
VAEVVDISLPLEERRQLTLRESGTLKLLLSDSQQQIIGVSKKRMKVLSPTSTPGIKVSLRPPVEMRYGVLFLDDDKLVVEGGESPRLVDCRSSVFQPRSAAVPRPPPIAAPRSANFLSSDEDSEVPEVEVPSSDPTGESGDVVVIESDDDSM